MEKETVSIESTLQEIAMLKKQISNLEAMLNNKKRFMAEYFDRTGKTSESNSDVTTFVQTKTTIEYDIAKLKEKVKPELFEIIVSKAYQVENWDEFTKLLKEHGIKGSQIKPYIRIEKSVDKKALSELYEKGEITIQELEGCYNAKVVKSIAIRLKNENNNA